MSGVNASCPPCPQPAQNATARIQEDQSKSLDVMKDMVSGKVSASDGMKQLQSLVVDQAVATGALPASAADKAGSPPSTGFSSKDTFEMGGAKGLLDLSGGGMRMARDFLALDSGGGAKPGIGSGTN